MSAYSRPPLALLLGFSRIILLVLAASSVGKCRRAASLRAVPTTLDPGASDRTRNIALPSIPLTPKTRIFMASARCCLFCVLVGIQGSDRVESHRDRPVRAKLRHDSPCRSGADRMLRFAREQGISKETFPASPMPTSQSNSCRHFQAISAAPRDSWIGVKRPEMAAAIRG